VLADRGFRVLSIAAPGMGETPPLESPDDYRPTRLAELVLDVAGERGIDRFVYMGFSWGASIGVHLAAGNPERVEALVLLDAGHTDVVLDATREQLEAEFAREQEQIGRAHV